MIEQRRHPFDGLGFIVDNKAKVILVPVFIHNNGIYNKHQPCFLLKA